VAVPAAAGIPVTHRGLSSSFAVVTGHEDPYKAAGGVDWHRLATAVDTLVILMGIATLPVIAAQLIAAGRDPATPAAVIERGLTANQRVVRGTLGNIAERAARLDSPAVIVIGEVAGLHYLENAQLGDRALRLARGAFAE
jgi:uroporphyrinogen III methyltransferase/synthase